ncbi:trans-Golgi network integral membrane protein 2-like [Pieris brassicae]|uniref:trans-Golgi network integral membrane protein 2-like n=1 Tax=Pieris brassicae TaxID=7116 RepID=UPI001E65FD54|nr:trans-Golgi network integral membrane protein 2-like [Pieris brassicae]
MAKYFLLLLQFLCLALALPVEENTIQIQNANITNELISLANSCENLFLSKLIKSQLEYCKTKPGYNHINMNCLIFYEINSQLCTAFGRSEIDLKLNYTNKINLTYNALTLCDDAKEWKSITPQYKAILDTLFKTKVVCVKVCSIDDTFSEDSNFFCKYFKWGTDLLTLQKKSMAEVVITNEPPNLDVFPETKSEEAITTNNAPISQNLNKESQEHKDLSDKSTKQEIPIKTDAIKQDTTKKSQPLANISTTKVEEKEPNKENDVPQSTLVSNKKPTNVEETLKVDVEKEIKDIEKENDFKPVVDNPNGNLEQDLDDTNNDFGNDLDSDDDPLSDADNINDGNELEPKVEKPLKENSSINKLPHTSFMDIPQREVYPNAIQDTISEEDDHFFPFFLTTIIFVVLLYVLYHNKSRLTKLVLGLIVEGRQTNRRRNSRGHAYRRLDTLEQAMSANSTAPPSKIIY